MTIEEKRKKHAEYQRKRYHSMTAEQKKEFLEKRKTIMKKYREIHKEEINKHIKEYYQKHKNKKSTINKKYYDAHKDTMINLKELKQENNNLKQALNEIRDKVKILGKYDGEKCTRGFSMYSADFNDILQIIDKGLGGEN